MVWLGIAVVLAIALGPLFWLLPSKSERRASAFRLAAKRLGLAVEVASIEKPDASAEERVSAAGVVRQPRLHCAAYRLPLSTQLFDAPRWRLVKSEGGSRYLAGWAAVTTPANVPSQGDYWQRLAAIVDALPGGCIGVEALPGAIVWYGMERLQRRDDGDAESVDAVVAGIRDGLQAIAALHRTLVPSAPPVEDG